MATEKSRDRRTLIAAAVLDTVADHALGKATLRSVARSADVSMGMVQHHFPSTAAFLRDSLSMALMDMRRRIDLQISAPSLQSDPQHVIKAIALAHLTADETASRLLRAITQFRATSEHDQSVRALIADNQTYYISLITQSLREGHDRRLLHRLSTWG